MTVGRIRKVSVALGVSAAVAAAGLIVSDAGASAPTTPSPTLARAPHILGGPLTSGACIYSRSVPADRFQGIPVFNATQAAQPYAVVMRTTQGTFRFRALTTKAPCTTFSFRFLAERGYFLGTHCQRLTTSQIFVLQCGDPTGTGAGGPGYTFEDENLSGATYPAGTVAMANDGPNTNGSQFFITWKDSKLRPAYTPFGVITAGMDVLQKIGAAGEDDQNSFGDGYPNAYTQFQAIKILTPARS